MFQYGNESQDTKGKQVKEFLNKIIRKGNPRWQFFRSVTPSSRILDLGCGSGDNGTLLRSIKEDIEVHGVDILPKNLVPPFYTYRCIDLDKEGLPYPDNYFDAVVFTHVIEHLQSPFELGKEISRVLKKQGQIYVETPNWTSVLVPSFGFRRKQHSPFNFYDDPSHVKPWSKHGLFEFLSQGCNCRTSRIGNTRNWIEVPLDFLIIPFGLLTGSRPLVVSSIWNLYGWCIYAIGVKE